mmetsp:Transcript_38945/g.97867  ORF Transcript_38945/g.97867 Transcript_38945/m.97867 type:complete len:420 (+) Transcript_38945:597-1856(+)
MAHVPPWHRQCHVAVAYVALQEDELVLVAGAQDEPLAPRPRAIVKHNEVALQMLDAHVVRGDFALDHVLKEGHILARELLALCSLPGLYEALQNELCGLGGRGRVLVDVRGVVVLVERILQRLRAPTQRGKQDERESAQRVCEAIHPLLPLRGVVQRHMEPVVLHAGREGVRGAALRVLRAEHAPEPGEQEGVAAHREHGAASDVGDFADDVRAGLADADTNAVLPDEFGVVLVGAAVHDDAGEGVLAGKPGLVDCLMGTRAHCNSVVDALVNGLPIGTLHNDVPPAWAALDRQHRGRETHVLRKVESLRILQQVVLVLRVVPMVPVACGRHVGEGHHVVADGEIAVVVDPVLLLAVVEYAAHIGLFLETLNIGDVPVLQLLDRGQAGCAGSDHADPWVRHHACKRRPPVVARQIGNWS